MNSIFCVVIYKGGSRTAATPKMERFVIVVHGFQSLTIITKRSISDTAVVLDPHLRLNCIDFAHIFAIFLSSNNILKTRDSIQQKKV